MSRVPQPWPWDLAATGTGLGHRALRSAVHIANRLLQPLDGPYTDDETEPGPIFVVGPPRSGTTLTYQALAAALDVAFFTRPFDVTFGMPIRTMRLLRHRLVAGNSYRSRFGRTDGYLHPAEHSNLWYRWFQPSRDTGHTTGGLEPDAEADLRRTMASIAAAADKPLIVKNVYLSLSVPQLAKAIPSARFVRVRRDPVMTCQSIIEARRRLEVTGWWSIQVPGYRQLEREPDWRIAAEQVKAVEASLDRAAADLGDVRIRSISYEELCMDPRHVLDATATWLGNAGITTRGQPELPAAFPLSGTLRLDPTTVAAIEAILAQ